MIKHRKYKNNVCGAYMPTYKENCDTCVGCDCKNKADDTIKQKDKECKAYVHTYKCNSDTCVGCEYRYETNSRDISKDPIGTDKCTCPSCGTHNEIIKKRRTTVHHDVVYCWHCGQAIKVEQIEEQKKEPEKSFWDMYKPGGIVYPSAVMRYFHISQSKAREMCNKLVAAGKLKDLYIIKCPCCGLDIKQRFYSANDVPDDMYCEHCDTEFSGAVNDNDHVYELVR